MVLLKLDVDFDGDLDVDGHTELDQLRVSGVSTFQGNVDLGDNDRLKFGDGGDLQIFHDGSVSKLLILVGQPRHTNGGASIRLMSNNGTETENGTV